MFFDLLTYGDKTAVLTDNGEQLSYKGLYLQSQEIAAHIPAGAFVFTLCDNHLGALVGYIALLDNHIAQVLLDAAKDIDTLLQLADTYHPDFFWLPENRVDEFTQAGLADQQIICSNNGYCLLKRNGTNDAPVHPDLLLCLTTSGSTGSPKFVRISEMNLKSNTEAIADYLSIDQNERPITSLPMYYSFGMSVLNSNLLMGATILLTDKTVVQREFWTFLKQEQATSIAGVPYTYETLKAFRFFRMDLPYLHTMIQAGGKLNAAIVKEYAEYAQSTGKRFFVMYGQTEASPRISYLPADRAIDKYGSIGIPVPGGRMVVADESGQEVTTPDTNGELVYYGPNVCMGYAECRADLLKGDENNGCLHTGDIACFDEEGFFYITGRMKRFVKIWGNRCNLDAIEQLVKAITPDCACVGVDNLVTIFVTNDNVHDDIYQLLQRKTGLNPQAFDIKTIHSIPKFDTGKTDYKSLTDLVNSL